MKILKKEKVYNKLVRDFIPEIIERENKIAITHKADEEEYENKLFEKLLEEINEFKKSKSIEELADIYEVLDAIIEFFKYVNEDILKLKTKKAEIRGKFTKRIILDSTIMKS